MSCLLVYGTWLQDTDSQTTDYRSPSHVFSFLVSNPLYWISFATFVSLWFKVFRLLASASDLLTARFAQDAKNAKRNNSLRPLRFKVFRLLTSDF